MTTELTIVNFPAAWTNLKFPALEEMVLSADAKRLESSMQLALLVRYIHDNFFKTKDNPKPPRLGEAGHDTFEEWCESLDPPRSKVWGHYLVKAADHAGRVANPGQARELSGLSEEQADAVVGAAKESGPVTAKTLAQAREEIVTRTRRQAREIEEAELGRKILKALLKAQGAADRHSGTPDGFHRALKKWIAYYREQQDLEERTSDKRAA